MSWFYIEKNLVFYKMSLCIVNNYSCGIFFVERFLDGNISKVD
jgi:hypothetical protein